MEKVTLELKNGNYCFNKKQYKENLESYNLNYKEIQEKIDAIKKEGYLLDNIKDYTNKYNSLHTILVYVKMETADKGKAYILNVNTINTYGKETFLSKIEL